MTPQETDFVQEQRVARLATVGAGDIPHVIPVCYAFDGRRFYTPLDEKPKRVIDRRLQRVRNIETNPRVSLLIDRYDEDWSQLAYVLIQGTASVLSPDHPDHPTALRLLRARYPQYTSMVLESRPVIVIEPNRVVSWGPV